MPSIKKIQESLDQIMALESEYSLKLKAIPNDFSIQLTLQSIKSQIAELQYQLSQENLKREKEIIKLKLKGSAAKLGSLPLSIVGGLTNSFSNVIINSSKYFQYGDKSGTKINKTINETIDLRLEGLGSGSTILYLSARTSPDLFGNSIIQNSLNNLFELLNSQTEEKIVENISKVGSKSIKFFSSFLNELNKVDLELDLTWHTQYENLKTWEGTKDRIHSIYNTLNNINFSEPEKIDFKGNIITLSLKGKFEILTTDKKSYNGTFPNELLETIKQLHVGDFCKGLLLKKTIFNKVTKKEKYEYSLGNITVME